LGGGWTDEKEVPDWIEQKLATINQSKRARATWIRGAVGEAKETLFKRAEVFVFPSYYAVEAQPLVVLEAMASGCAILTTRIGEVPSTVGAEGAEFLESSAAAVIANAIDHLAQESARRRALGEAARQRYAEEFSRTAHDRRWDSLFQRLESGAAERAGTHTHVI
jgi:glycosyltransferase involved in cell wall biosynthesis